MSYIKEILGDGEKLEYAARISPLSFIGSYFWMAAMGVLAVICAGAPGLSNMAAFLCLVILGTAVRIYIYYIGTELGLTDRRVIAKTGFIRRDTIEINLNKVESIHIAQSVPGRIFNYGTITIAGSGTSHAPIRGVDAPLVFRKKFDEVSNKNKA